MPSRQLPCDVSDNLIRYSRGKVKARSSLDTRVRTDERGKSQSRGARPKVIKFPPGADSASPLGRTAEAAPREVTRRLNLQRARSHSRQRYLAVSIERDQGTSLWSTLAVARQLSDETRAAC